MFNIMLKEENLSVLFNIQIIEIIGLWHTGYFKGLSV